MLLNLSTVYWLELLTQHSYSKFETHYSESDMYLGQVYWQQKNDKFGCACAGDK